MMIDDVGRLSDSSAAQLSISLLRWPKPLQARSSLLIRRARDCAAYHPTRHSEVRFSYTATLACDDDEKPTFGLNWQTDLR
jgi:hypothetical protein